MDAIPTTSSRPHVEVVIQPDPKGIRFRYTCESRSASTIPGEESTPEIKTYPTIEIFDYNGPAHIVVSCVTHDKPYRPHPHNLVGKKNCQDGICVVTARPDQRRIPFNFGVQCVTKNEATESLNVRKNKRVDPFKTGFDHAKQVNSLNFKAIRLCFQVFMEINGKKVPLQPVVSNEVYDIKAVNDFLIKELSHCSGPVSGKKKVIILCNKIVKGTTVTFFDVDGWEENATIMYTHKQAAITFTTPPYHNLKVTEPVEVFVQLRGRTIDARGEPRSFELIPDKLVDPSYLKRKRRRTISMEIQNEQDFSSSQAQVYCPPQASTSTSYPHVTSSSTYYWWDQPKSSQTANKCETNPPYAPLATFSTNTMNVNQTPQSVQNYLDLAELDLNLNQSLNYNNSNVTQVQDTQNVEIGNSGQMLCDLNPFTDFNIAPSLNVQEIGDILSDLESGNIQIDLLDQEPDNSNQSIQPSATTSTIWYDVGHDGDDGEDDSLSSRFSNLSSGSSSEDSI